MAKTIKKVAKFVLPIAGAAFGGPAGAALGGAAAGAIGGGGLKGALIGGATGYAGNAIGSSLASSLSNVLGKAGSASIGSLTSKNSMGPFSFGDLGGATANTIGNTIANTTASQALGSVAGNSIADSLAQGLFPQNQEVQEQDLAPEKVEPEPFVPRQEGQLSLPGNLTGSAMDPNQLSSNLATQGVYGGGIGPEEEAYFRNLINRRLVDESGRVDADLSELNPIEMSYLSQLGLGGNNPTSILEALSRYGART